MPDDRADPTDTRSGDERRSPTQALLIEYPPNPTELRSDLEEELKAFNIIGGWDQVSDQLT